jgi:ankyrin repeat-rich membrane spanning protein
VDALDSCDTERTLSMLNAIQTLLSSAERPFVLLLAVDPHVVAKAAEANSRRLFTEGLLSTTHLILRMKRIN